MWCDDFPPDKSWGTLWSDYIICDSCSGIRRIEDVCQACGAPVPSFEPKSFRLKDGRDIVMPPSFMGAEGRYEDWIYLEMLEREWKRSVIDADSPGGLSTHSSPRAAIVLVFWSYFETRIGRLLRAGMRDVPIRFLEDALRRYSFIGMRLSQFYNTVFGTTYASDLTALGYEHIWNHLSRVQERRNDFVHGKPQAIDNNFVGAVIAMLKVEHESWIAVFNKRVARC